MSVLPPWHDTDISVLRVVYSFHFPSSLDANNSHGELLMDGINSVILSVTYSALQGETGALDATLKNCWLLEPTP